MTNKHSNLLLCNRSVGNDGETAVRDVRRRSLGAIFRRISSASNSGKHYCSKNDCYKWDEHRREDRPVYVTCTQHPGGYRCVDGQSRARTYSVPVAGHRGAVDAAAAVALRLARLQCAADLDDSQPPADYVRVRSFSTSSRGVKNRGDSFKRRKHRALSLSCAENNCVNGGGNLSLTPTTDVCTAAELKVVVVGDGRWSSWVMEGSCRG